MQRSICWLVIACAALLASTTFAQDYEALYQARFAAMLANKGMLNGYEPMERVPGAGEYTPLPEASGAGLSIDEDALKEATRYAGQNNSSAFIVWRDGLVQTRAFFGDTTAATPLVSKSLSKPLSAVAIGRAIQLGAIQSLDQPVSDFITEWRGTPKADMQIRHMLDMRSGFLAQGFSPDPDHPWNRAYLSYEHDEYLVDEYPLTDPPGTKYAYSNATAELVAIVIERATGQRYADFIGHEVLARIGAPGGEIWVDRVGGLAHSGCCMFLPAESWLRLAILLLDDGRVDGVRLLPQGYVASMRSGTEQNPHYGLGLWIGGEYTMRRGFTGPDGPGPKVLHSEPYLDEDLYLFDGNSNQVVYILPNYRMVVLRLGATPPKSPEWDNSYLPNMLVRGLLANETASSRSETGER